MLNSRMGYFGARASRSGASELVVQTMTSAFDRGYDVLNCNRSAQPHNARSRFLMSHSYHPYTDNLCCLALPSKKSGLF